MSYPMTLDDIARDIHAFNRSKGFYDREYLTVIDSILGDVEARIPNPSLPSEKLMLIVTEVSEAQSELRDEDRNAEEEEIADILIRTLDYAAWRGFSMDSALWAKIGKNRDRPHLHGRSF